jgi:hypothetical protein
MRNGKLRLYHYTQLKNVFGISVGGLQPHKYDPPDDLLTLGHSVVWLTSQTSLTPTPADKEHVLRLSGEVGAERFADSMLLEKDTRLEVNLSTDEKTRSLVNLD